eukprot:scaffold703_cov168-Amphora_coffeaeformis.AAC.30
MAPIYFPLSRNNAHEKAYDDSSKDEGPQGGPKCRWSGIRGSSRRPSRLRQKNESKEDKVSLGSPGIA